MVLTTATKQPIQELLAACSKPWALFWDVLIDNFYVDYLPLQMNDRYDFDFLVVKDNSWAERFNVCILLFFVLYCTGLARKR